MSAAIAPSAALLEAADRIERRTGAAVLAFGEIDSTQERALRRIRAGAAEGAALFLADAQTAGRGRGDRRWLAPPGSSFLGTAVAPVAAMDGGLAWTHRVAVAVALALEAIGGARIEIKWPNDLLLGRGKVAGILVNRVDRWIAAGVGVNLFQEPHELPERPAGVPPATSLRRSAPRFDGTAADALADIGTALLAALLQPPAAAAVLRAYRERWADRGLPVRGIARVGPVEGLAERVADDGTLLVRTAGGAVHALVAPEEPLA